MSAAGNWLTEISLFTDFFTINIFIEKTTWYGTYVKIFEPIDIVKDFLDMKAWLDEEQPSNVETEEIWGVLQLTYTIKDMHAWMNSGGTLQQKKKRSPTPDDCSKGTQ